MSANTARNGGLIWIPDHVREQWARRAPCGPRNLFAVWWEATPIDYPSAKGWTIARYHAATGLILLARGGALVTVVQLRDRPDQEQAYVREQVKNQ